MQTLFGMQRRLLVFCPRLSHFRRVNSNGTYGACGHMVNGLNFNTIEEVDKWCASLKHQFDNNAWPNECSRCKHSEDVGTESIRQYSITKHKDLVGIKEDYLIVGGTLDNYCNSGCLTCSPNLSTKIGKLENRRILNDNVSTFANIPQDKILQLDINGGEPSYSKNYQKLLENLPPNLVYLRINTNGHRVMPNIENVLDQGIHVNVTLSLDGTGEVHDYVRWPIKWEDYTNTVKKYKTLAAEYSNLTLDFWTTLSVLNLHNYTDIVSYAKHNSIPHAFGFLATPECLSVKKTNWITKEYSSDDIQTVATEEENSKELEQFLTRQEMLRNLTRAKLY
jgi:sulfatase maturation enzyme AslB (radical SAM superfamily)